MFVTDVGDVVTDVGAEVADIFTYAPTSYGDARVIPSLSIAGFDNG